MKEGGRAGERERDREGKGERLITHPLGPTSPYLRPAVTLSEALTNRSLPRAEREKLSILMSVVPSSKTSFCFVSLWETENCDS